MKILTPLCCLLFLAGLSSFAAPPPVNAVVDRALDYFQDEDYDHALVDLMKADQLAPNSPFILNMLGAALTKKKQYAEANQYFQKALAIDYSFFPAKFNVGELFFLQKQYPQALDHFSSMLRDAPGNELLEFKVILCLLQTNQLAEAEKIAATMAYPGDEPAWFFSHAAIAMKQNNRKRAAEYVTAANEYFADKTALYLETFKDLGWPTH